MSGDDFSHYLEHIAHLDMPLESKIEVLRTLQVLMQSFVDRAFGEDSVQLASIDGSRARSSGDCRTRSMAEMESYPKPTDLSGKFGATVDLSDGRKE